MPFISKYIRALLNEQVGPASDQDVFLNKMYKKFTILCIYINLVGRGGVTWAKNESTLNMNGPLVCNLENHQFLRNSDSEKWNFWSQLLMLLPEVLSHHFN